MASLDSAIPNLFSSLTQVTAVTYCLDCGDGMSRRCRQYGFTKFMIDVENGLETEKIPGASELRECLNELGMSPSQLSSEFSQMGDYRSHSAILRSIQRALAGETAVSGEMFVIIQLLLRQHRRWTLLERKINWSKNQHGDICAEVDGYRIKLHHFYNKSWQIHVIHQESGYSHPYPAYPDSLKAAKIKAVECMELAEAVLSRNKL